MPWNGSGGFSRLYSWIADKAAGLNITASRMDADSNDLATSGFGNCLTRDGQGQPTANLPMATFRHTGVGNAANRTDYAALNQAQDGLIGWTIAGGSADALTATFTPGRGTPSDGALYSVRVAAPNATPTPTFAPDGQTARTITKSGGGALVPGDIPGNLAEIILRYNNANTRYELLNPVNTGLITTGAVMLTVATLAPTGWLMFDDGTFGSAASGSSNSNSALNQALFTLMFNNLSDTAAPILTSTGSGTTRAGQGTAAAAWAANCRMTLPKTLGRALGVAGAGSGLTSRALGSITGAESVTLGTGNLPPYTPQGTNGSISVMSTRSDIMLTPTSSTTGGGGFGINYAGASGAVTSTGSGPTFTGTAQGGTSVPFGIMQPTTWFNVMIRQ